MLNDNSDVLDLVSQVEAQILALDYPSKILVAACRCHTATGRWCRVPELIGCRAPSIMAAMNTPLTMDECMYAMADLAKKHGVEVLSISDLDLASMVEVEALSKMRQIVVESKVTV